MHTLAYAVDTEWRRAESAECAAGAVGAAAAAAGASARAAAVGVGVTSAPARGAASSGASEESSERSTRAADALLLPLLKLLRLVIASPPPVEAAHKLRTDLVCLLLYCPGLRSLQEYCASRTVTLRLAAAHQPLLLQYTALIHALLLPLRAHPGSSCAAPLRAFLKETGVGGLPALACSILVEAKEAASAKEASGAIVRAADEGAADARAGAADARAAPLPRRPVNRINPLTYGKTQSDGGRHIWEKRLFLMLTLVRASIQMLIHLGCLEASFLRRALGGGVFRVELFQICHLVLHLNERLGTSPPGGRTPPATAELRALLHDVLLLLGTFTLGSRGNAEILRWRWGEHPTMLHRLSALPFRYFCQPRLRLVLLPTLVCACLRDEHNIRILSERLSPAHLVRFLREEQAANAPTEPPLAASLIADPSELPIVSMDFRLAARLPPAEWRAALEFFESASVPPESKQGKQHPERRSQRHATGLKIAT